MLHLGTMNWSKTNMQIESVLAELITRQSPDASNPVTLKSSQTTRLGLMIESKDGPWAPSRSL